MTITTDASLLGWGAHSRADLAQGQWTHSEQQQTINFLELRAICLGFLHFQSKVEGKHVLLLMDNMTAKAHVNRQGGTRSRRLMIEAQRLLGWVESHLLSVWAKHIAVTANVTADWLSRSQVDQAE